MDGESGFIQIALKLKVGFLEKTFVIRVVRDRGQLTDCLEGPQPLQVDVKETVRARQKPGSFWRRPAPELDHSHQSGGYEQHSNPNRESAFQAHRSVYDSTQPGLDYRFCRLLRRAPERGKPSESLGNRLFAHGLAF